MRNINDRPHFVGLLCRFCLCVLPCCCPELLQTNQFPQVARDGSTEVGHSSRSVRVHPSGRRLHHDCRRLRQAQCTRPVSGAAWRSVLNCGGHTVDHTHC